jgi:hypothetical protein
VINTMIGRSRQASLTSGPTRLTQLKLQPARQTSCLFNTSKPRYDNVDSYTFHG